MDNSYFLYALGSIVDNNCNTLDACLDRGTNFTPIPASSVINERNTLLHIAAMGASKGVVEALLHAGANPMIKNDAGQLPIDLTKDEGIRNLLSSRNGCNPYFGQNLK